MRTRKAPWNRFWRIAAIGGLVLVLAGLLYHVPIHRSMELELYDEEGDRASAQLEISLHRSFFSPTVMRGSIQLDGIRYSTAPILEDTSKPFFEKLRLKLENRIISGYFVEDGALEKGGTAIELMQNSLWVVKITFHQGYTLEDICLAQMCGDAGDARIWSTNLPESA